MDSSENVQQMNVDELCEWLKPKVTGKRWKVVEEVIREQDIMGNNFLNYTKADWKADGLPGGIADSLFQIAQGVLQVKTLTLEMTEVALMDLLKHMPAPSSFAKQRDKGYWVNFLHEHPNKIICHRVVSEEPSIPVCLLRVQFLHNLFMI
jgi:hypothetical protein